MLGKAVWSRSVVTMCALVAWLAVPAQAQQLKLDNSGQKYKERNPAGGKGRAGGASLTARMLYGKNGVTQMEATTGEFNSPTPPPGVIWKLQVSALDALGVVMSTTQYKDPEPASGYFSQSIPTCFPDSPSRCRRTSAPVPSATTR